MERKLCDLNFKVKAFTLLECLVALLAISGSALVISGLPQMLKEQVAISQSDSINDWQIFCQQMRFELSGTKLDRVEQNFLYVTKDKKLRFGFMSDDFRKTDDKGQGYQPMLYDIKAAKIQATKNLITIRIDFNQGGERTFIFQKIRKRRNTSIYASLIIDVFNVSSVLFGKANR